MIDWRAIMIAGLLPLAGCAADPAAQLAAVRAVDAAWRAEAALVYGEVGQYRVDVGAARAKEVACIALVTRGFGPIVVHGDAIGGARLGQDDDMSAEGYAYADRSIRPIYAEHLGLFGPHPPLYPFAYVVIPAVGVEALPDGGAMLRARVTLRQSEPGRRLAEKEGYANAVFAALTIPNPVTLRESLEAFWRDVDAAIAANASDPRCAGAALRSTDV